MINIIIVLIYWVLCLKNNFIWILSSLIIVFPAHSTLKQLLFISTGGAGFFALWYDIAIFTLLFKALFIKHHHIRFIKSLLLLLGILSLYLLVSQMSSKPDTEALSTYRIYVHCICLFVALSIYKYSNRDLTVLKNVFVCSTIIYSITAIFIYFFFQYETHILLGHIEYINGTMQYNSPSFLIMGIERMFGLVGGPNQFGMLIAIYILLLLLIINNRAENLFIIKTALLLSIICCILTFSRAGWGIILITICCVNILKGKISKILGVLFLLSLILGVIFIILQLIAPDFANIIISSVTGEEASVSARGEIVKDGFTLILQNILGHGLGTGIEESGAPVAESSVVICLYEMGIVGTILLYYLLINISIYIFKSNVNYSKMLLSFTFATIIASVISMNPFQFPFIYFCWGILGLASNRSIQYLSKKYAYT